ncbi:MAG: DNA-binding protein [Firmicutes bacterium]|nr:DNA-binding protein [Bacillota bacterium]
MGIKTRQVQYLCTQGKIYGAARLGRAWLIPKGTQKPLDGRTNATKEIRAKIDAIKAAAEE